MITKIRYAVTDDGTPLMERAEFIICRQDHQMACVVDGQSAVLASISNPLFNMPDGGIEWTKDYEALPIRDGVRLVNEHEYSEAVESHEKRISELRNEAFKYEEERKSEILSARKHAFDKLLELGLNEEAAKLITGHKE